MGIWEYVLRKSRLRHGEANYGYTLRTNMGTRNLSKLVSGYVQLIKNGESPNSLKPSFMKAYRVIKNKDAAEYTAFHSMVRSPKKASSGRPPRTPVRRTTPAANAMINRLKANLRNQISKLTQARNHYQRELNKTQRKLNAIP
jgi:hypothetical protein